MVGETASKYEDDERNRHDRTTTVLATEIFYLERKREDIVLSCLLFVVSVPFIVLVFFFFLSCYTHHVKLLPTRPVRIVLLQTVLSGTDVCVLFSFSNKTFQLRVQLLSRRVYSFYRPRVFEAVTPTMSN
ncbi:MAG: hypothetical protein O7D30_05760, partial [Rickettsia endosymbiont of Ixodes persulcatus]|nr:hypothetical protein [Rickettsia endosymbiont of Ixodes persulcatus]